MSTAALVFLLFQSQSFAAPDDAAAPTVTDAAPVEVGGVEGGVVGGTVGGTVGGEAAPEPQLPTREEIIAVLTQSGMSEADAGAQADAVLAQLTLTRSLNYQTGDIPLGQGLATLHLPQDFAYLNPTDADKVLVAWGNPPGGAGLGMLVSQNTDLFSAEGWAVILDYSADGYVEDDDAQDIDYDDMLKDMKQGSEDANKDRGAAG